ncbi:response regulator, partial [Herbaspirillum lusitanum]|uniref:response regulator n=1 Tax=Herbaspirillum lusitanum TaxID=213312 RepID=UPI000493E31B
MTALAILIEDEQSVRKATTQTLELGGFSVQACADAEQALPLLHAGFAGIVVTDVRLPGRSGLEVLAHAVAADADLPVIVVTGHGDVMADHGGAGGALVDVDRHALAQLQRSQI